MTTTEHHGSRARRALERVRDRIRSVAVGEQLSAGLAGALGWLLGAGLVDYLFRLPGWFRLALLLVGLGLLAAAVWRRLVPTMRTKPRLSTVALKIEESELGRELGLKSVLASGVALAGANAEETNEDWGEDTELVRTLRRRAAEHADERLGDAEPWRIVETATLRRRALWAGAVALVMVAIAAISPSTAWTGLSRQIAPLGDAAWPRRFEVVDVTGAAVHPLGTAIPVRALVTRTSRSLGQTPVTVVHRVVSEEGASSWRREPATPQQVYESAEGGLYGEAFERLLDVPVVASNDEDPAVLEYYFETPDDRTETARVQLIEQPAVVGFEVAITPPTYAGDAAGAFVAGVQRVEADSLRRGLIGPVLAGSSVVVTVELNKPATPVSAEILSGIGEDDAPTNIETEIADRSIAVRWSAESSARLVLGVRDRFGLESLEDATLRFDVVQDAAPTSAVVVPMRDESVLATAIIDIEAEGRDDVALAWVGIESVRARVPSGSEGAEPEPEAEATELVRVETSETRQSATTRIDLSTQGLVPGDVLIVTGLAADRYERETEAGTATHEVARSEPRRLRVISESELLDEVLAELGGVRRSAIRLDEQQFEIGEGVREAREQGETPDAESARRQSAVSESLAAMQESIERVAERVDRNGLQDESLDRVLREAAAASERGEQAAERAADALREAASDETDADEQHEATQEAAEASDEVRQALEDLARTLDRGDDAWSMRRALEGLVSDQQAVSEETASASAATVGRSADELTEQERSVLDDIARRQLEIAERAAELLDELEDRAEQSADGDPGQSAAMRAASRRGREQGVAQQLREASRAVSQNRGAEAGRAQADAQEQLEEMLRDLEDAERQRDAELQRALLSLVETIESLIRDQQAELAKLEAGEVALAGGMERLHRNTLSAIDEAARDTALVAVATPLREAASAQTAAIVLLRAAGDPAETRAAEERSLAALERALEAAQAALDDANQREQDRKRQEVQDAYRAALEAQVAITGETTAYADRRLNRRERAALRDLAEREAVLREDIEAVRTLFPEVTQARVFDFAHTRLNDTLGGIEDALASGDAGGLTALDQASVERLLRGLIAALDPPDDGEEQDFDQGGGGGGGGQQGGEQPLVPPIAELQMLRTLQQDVYDRTRAVNEAGLGDEAADRISAEQRAIASQAQSLLEAMQQQGPGGPAMPEPPAEPEANE
ncbi:MAG: hypothetical protein AAFN41_00190 [Planctomycetota bacterium]